MQKRFFLTASISLVLLCAFAGGCAWLPGAKERAEKPKLYAQARDLKVIKVPEHLAEPEYEDFFPVPAGQVSKSASKTKGALELKAPAPMDIVWDDEEEQQEEKKTVSLLAEKNASKSPARSGVEIKKFQDSAVLRMDQDFNYAWGALSDAVKAAEFPVSDIDRSQARFYLQLKTKRNKSKLFWQAEKRQLLKKADKHEVLILQIKKQTEGVIVAVENKQGEAVDYALAEFILRQLKEHLEEG